MKKFGIELKLLLITTISISLALSISAFVNLKHFINVYENSIIDRIAAQTIELKTTINDVIDLGLEIGELKGLNSECKKLIKAIPFGKYCYVMSSSGKVVYHSTSSEAGNFFTDPATKKTINAKENLLQRVKSSDDESIYDLSIPIKIHSKKIIGWIRVGVLTEIVNKEITERKRAESESLEAKVKAELITQVVPNSIFTIDTENLITSWNNKIAEVTGYSQEELLGKPCPIFKKNTPLTKAIIAQECIITCKDGESKTVLKNADLLKDSEDDILGAIICFEDITDRKQQEEELRKMNDELTNNENALKDALDNVRKSHEELKEAQGQLVQSEKLASLGQLSAGVAHEINNPMAFIANNISMMEQYMANYKSIFAIIDELKASITSGNLEEAQTITSELKETEKNLNIEFIKNDIPQLLDESKNGAERIKKIVEDLRTFARKDEGQMEYKKIEEVIDGCINIVWNQIKYSSELKKDYGDIPIVKCNAQKLGQVFINLLINASQAMKDKGEILIKTYATEEFAFIEISDTGCGIKQEELKKIFDPFFTTKDVGSGTGLGLSISYDIIKQHNGEMFAFSKIDEGTTFTIKLPYRTEES